MYVRKGKNVKLTDWIGEKVYSILVNTKKGSFLKKQPAYDMKKLYPGKNSEEKIKDYYIKKTGEAVCVLIIGVLFAGITFLMGHTEDTIIDRKYIARNDYGQGEKQAEITASFQDGSKEEVTLTIGERRFEDVELEQLYEQALAELVAQIFPEGSCAEEVRGNLNLPEILEGFPFSIQWESNNYEVVDYDGTVYNEKLAAEGEIVNLSAVFRYYEFEREYSFSVRVLPPVFSEEQLRRNALAESIEQSENKSIYEENYMLPDRVAGEDVEWEEKQESGSGVILLLACVAAMAVYYMKDYELHKQVTERQEEMTDCYPEIVNRLVLYVGAGMTVRNAWRKIALDYKKEKEQGSRKGYIYQEMLFTCYEMDSGVAEGEAYERFGRRCGIQHYIKLATLLVQNMQKGNSTLLIQLQEEAETAFIERMNRARKKGEEAGTKLLMPMMLLLGMVMVLIMIPAFGTFGS